MEGIVAATSNAAEAMGLADIGRIEPGAVADLVVLDGDPLTHPAVLLDAGRIRLVVQGGEILSAAPRPRRGTRTEEIVSAPPRAHGARCCPSEA